MRRGAGEAGRLLVMLFLALTVTCGGSSDGGSCPSPDGGLSCVDVCGDVGEFRRFACDKAPFMLCDSLQNPARPLRNDEVEYVVAKCRQCSGCSKSCQSCNAGLPPY